MFKFFKIENYEDFDKKQGDYIIGLATNIPRVEFLDESKSATVRNYLWYYFQDKPQPDTYIDFYQEKLAATEDQAERMIEDFNKSNSFEKVKFSKTFSIRGKRFGVIEYDEDCIIMMNRTAFSKNHKHVFSTGNAWQYYNEGRNLQQNFQLTDAETRQLKTKMKK